MGGYKKNLLLTIILNYDTVFSYAEVFLMNEQLRSFEMALCGIADILGKIARRREKKFIVKQPVNPPLPFFQTYLEKKFCHCVLVVEHKRRILPFKKKYQNNGGTYESFSVYSTCGNT